MDHGRRRLHSGSTPRGGERPAKRERISVEEQQSQEIRNLKRKLEEARQREDKYIKNEQLHHTAMRSKQQRIERMEKSMESTNRKMYATQCRLNDMENIYDDLEMESKIMADFIDHYYDSRNITEEDRDELQDKLDEEAANYRDLEDRIKEVRHRDRYMKTVETERKRTTFYRKKMLELAEQLQFEQQEVTGETPLWKLCEICAHQFSHSDEYVPRVLVCGHTLCTSCIEKLDVGDGIRCPFCRTWTNMKRIEALPKNFQILQM
ncbi:RING-type domain-containing protein [Caenorhabditis elegans]|uniref:RING-type domain-containing protein n=1 Tax=Caenorhabditis elegans TaxID=6239 RepID=Q20369_CAEEL|nr:RING-type domain-containing protein [Caenorhabditis elegans]CAA90397.1 RING-type domain-containing protein [Caenorhabditis elegans]|eukprot:NP_496523.1 Uncharacterized protein CELE_F43G6.8 [Caenorhabditis elegans]